MNSNLAVLFGTVHQEPTCRDLPSGSVVAQFDVVTVVDRGERSSTVTVPVSWSDPSPRALGTIRAGEQVVVIGRVERRFFRSGGATQSRTEVVVEHCIPARRSKTVRGLVSAAAETLVADSQ